MLSCINSIISLIRFPTAFSLTDYLFSGLSFIKLIAMVLLLSRENDRLMNLKFASPQVGFRKTYILIKSLNITVCIIIPAIILLILTFVSAEKMVYLNGYSLFWLIIFVFTLIGIINRSKFLLPGFAVSLLLVADLFHSSYIFIIAPFTGNWNNGWDQLSIVIGLLLFFGLFIFFIAHAYFKEKAELKDQSGILL